MISKEHTDKFKLANYFILNGKGITLKKLQKLLYYSYAWDLVINNDKPINLVPLFNHNFILTIHGIIDLDIEERYEQYSYNLLPKPTKANITCPHCIDILEQVIYAYGDFNGNELANLNRNELINNKDIKRVLLEPTKELVPSDKELYQIYYQQLDTE